MLTSKEIVAVVTAGVAAAGIFIGAISVAFALRNGPDAQTAGFVATIALLVGVGATARAVTLRRLHDHQGPMTEARRADGEPNIKSSLQRRSFVASLSEGCGWRQNATIRVKWRNASCQHFAIRSAIRRRRAKPIESNLFAQCAVSLLTQL